MTIAWNQPISRQLIGWNSAGSCLYIHRRATYLAVVTLLRKYCRLIVRSWHNSNVLIFAAFYNIFSRPIARCCNTFTEMNDQDSFRGNSNENWGGGNLGRYRKGPQKRVRFSRKAVQCDAIWMIEASKVSGSLRNSLGLWPGSWFPGMAPEWTPLAKGAIRSKIKHAIKLKTYPARLAQLLQPSLAFCFSLQPMTAYRPVLDGTPSLAAS